MNVLYCYLKNSDLWGIQKQISDMIKSVRQI